MVQMKAIRYRHPAWYNNLYIPHGSDESERTILRVVGSTLLYIPHGSDEREEELEVEEISSTNFISHMVQMKAHP